VCSVSCPFWYYSELLPVIFYFHRDETGKQSNFLGSFVTFGCYRSALFDILDPSHVHEVPSPNGVLDRFWPQKLFKKLEMRIRITFNQLMRRRLICNNLISIRHNCNQLMTSRSTRTCNQLMRSRFICSTQLMRRRLICNQLMRADSPEIRWKLQTHLQSADGEQNHQKIDDGEQTYQYSAKWEQTHLQSADEE